MPEKKPPAFVPGEKLTFELRWGIIPAGTAVLEVLPIETINGRDAYHFTMTVTSNSFVDKFYKVRDRIDAYTDIAVTRSLGYKKHQREGRSKRDIVVEFNWDLNQAQYSNFGKPLDPIEIMPGTFDPFSIFYFTRITDWDKNNSMEQPVTDGKKMIIGKSRLISRKKISVPAGEFDALLFEPNIEKIGGVFEKSKNAKIEIWVTDDHRRIPLRLKSKVAVGSFVGELVSMEGMPK